MCHGREVIQAHLRCYRKYKHSNEDWYRRLKRCVCTLVKNVWLSSVFVQVVEKELLIQEKEKLYMELKHILARQPGPEVAEQLQIYQQTLKEKTKQMKVKLTS